jgi:hypothetical protein
VLDAVLELLVPTAPVKLEVPESWLYNLLDIINYFEKKINIFIQYNIK